MILNANRSILEGHCRHGAVRRNADHIAAYDHAHLASYVELHAPALRATRDFQLAAASPKN